MKFYFLNVKQCKFRLAYGQYLEVLVKQFVIIEIQRVCAELPCLNQINYKTV